MAPLGLVGKISDEFEWRIPDFFSLSKEADNCEISDTFSFAGESWYLSVYPNGKTRYNTVGHIGLLLTRCSSGLPIILEYTFSLRTLKGEKFKEEHCTYNFTDAKQGYGICNYITRQQLLKKKSELLPADVLTVICVMKHPKSMKNKGRITTKQCSYCKVSLNSEIILSHEKRCIYKSIKCPKFSEVGCIENLKGHQCDTPKARDETITISRPETTSLTTQEKLPLITSRKCPECSTVVDPGKLYDHKCFMARAEAIEKLLRDLKRLMLSGDHSDTKLRVQMEEFRLHKCILSARNPFFELMFKKELRQQTADTVHITDFEPDQFRSLIHYIYTGTADKISPENVCNLYEIADRYREEQLKAECLQFMMNTISVDNFCDIIALALKDNEQQLLKAAVEFFPCKAREIIRSVKWKSFVKKYPEQADELFMKALDCDNK